MKKDEYNERWWRLLWPTLYSVTFVDSVCHAYDRNSLIRLNLRLARAGSDLLGGLVPVIFLTPRVPVDLSSWGVDSNPPPSSTFVIGCHFLEHTAKVFMTMAFMGAKCLKAFFTELQISAA